MQKQNNIKEGLNEEELEFQKLLKSLVIAQAHLEILDEIKCISSFYKSTNKKRIDTLNSQLEKSLGSRFSRIFQRDEKTFLAIIDDIEVIAEWVSKNYFEDINALANAIREDALKFVNSENDGER